MRRPAPDETPPTRTRRQPTLPLRVAQHRRVALACLADRPSGGQRGGGSVYRPRTVAGSASANRDGPANRGGPSRLGPAPPMQRTPPRSRRSLPGPAPPASGRRYSERHWAGTRGAGDRTGRTSQRACRYPARVFSACADIQLHTHERSRAKMVGSLCPNTDRLSATDCAVTDVVPRCCRQLVARSETSALPVIRNYMLPQD